MPGSPHRRVLIRIRRGESSLSLLILLMGILGGGAPSPSPLCSSRSSSRSRTVSIRCITSDRRPRRPIAWSLWLRLTVLVSSGRRSCPARRPAGTWCSCGVCPERCRQGPIALSAPGLRQPPRSPALIPLPSPGSAGRGRHCATSFTGGLFMARRSLVVLQCSRCSHCRSWRRPPRSEVAPSILPPAPDFAL